MNRKSYSFYIKPKNDSIDKYHLKNLVFSKQDSETIYTLQIVSYYLPDGIDKSSKNIIIENIENLDSQTGLPNKNINGKSSSCEPSWSTIEIYHACTGGQHHIGPNSGCDLTGSNRPYSTFLLVYNGCGGSGGTSGSGDGPGNPSGPGGGGNGGHPVDTGLSLPPSCQTGDCDEVILPNEINNFLGNKLNGTQLLFLNDHPEVAQELYNKLYINKNYFTLETVVFGIKFLDENPDTANPEQIFARIKALDNLLTQNPDALLDVPCSELPKWRTVATYQIPQSVKDKLSRINNLTHWYQDNATIQTLQGAEGKSINMDYFPIEIETLPKKQNSNERYTPKEFFDYFRLHINDFVNSNYGKFTPVENNEFGIHDTALWNSANPLNALISIYIPVAPLLHNNGTVACSGYDPSYWVFTTISSPWDWEHPVSGNRFFGYTTDGSKMTLYTRGVDKVQTSAFNVLDVQNNPAFQGADILWTDMQLKVASFVNKPESNGIALISEPKKYRPDWVNAVGFLKGVKPLSSLGCK